MDAADFIGQMCQQFRVYHKEGSAEEAQWSDGMIAVLSGYTDEVLADACLWFWQHRKETRFPLSAEIITVCDEVSRERARPKLLAAVETGRPVQHVHKRALALDLLRTQQGREAAADGWVLALYEFIAEQGRAPTNQERHSYKTLERGVDGIVRWTTHRCTEVEWLRMSAKGAQEAHEASIRGGFPFATAWARMGDERSARRERLAQHATGEIDLRGRVEI
jgi:hypothetical protein